MELSLLSCTTHCNKSSRSRFHNCLPLYLLSSSDADKTGLRSLQYLFWSQAYQTVIIAFFQKGCYRKKGTWDAKNFKRHFNYKISLCGAETLKRSTSFLTDFSDLTLYSVIPFLTPSNPAKLKKKYICRHVCAHTHIYNIYTEAHVYIFKVINFLNRGLKLMTEQTADVSRLYVPKITVFEGTQHKKTQM